MSEKFDLLVKMQPSRKRPKPGDVFVVQPKEGLYYYGKVIRKFETRSRVLNGLYLVYVYAESSTLMEMPHHELSPEYLLIPPQAVNTQGWLKGYYQTIGNVDVTELEQNLDIGYWHTAFSKMYDEDGNEMQHEPKVRALYAVSSYGSMGYKIDKVLGFNRVE